MLSSKWFKHFVRVAVPIHGNTMWAVQGKRPWGPLASSSQLSFKVIWRNAKIGKSLESHAVRSTLLVVTIILYVSCSYFLSLWTSALLSCVWSLSRFLNRSLLFTWNTSRPGCLAQNVLASHLKETVLGLLFSVHITKMKKNFGQGFSRWGFRAYFMCAI